MKIEVPLVSQTVNQNLTVHREFSQHILRRLATSNVIFKLVCDEEECELNGKEKAV